jgi:hypothetical protein
MAQAAGFEPALLWFVARSILQLCYACIMAFPAGIEPAL